ncbi:MAG: glycine--tRNA ligase subunit beta [Thermaerobacter sp.]|nr:glycine--tRNA ligase subunit beta [Thermaerobacter sp.]
MELIVEFGFPELPSSVVAQAEQDLRALTLSAVQDALLAEGDLEAESYSTPRRLAVRLSPLRLAQPDREVEARGPSVAQAFKDGQPTKAAEGFARSQGTDVAHLERRETPQGEYLFAKRKVAGRPAKEVLLEILPQVLTQMRFPRTMRWADGAPRLPRPLIWAMGLMGGEVLPFAIGPVTAGSETYGHRVTAPGPHAVESAKAYACVLRGADVEPDRAVRRARVADGVRAAAEEQGLRAEIPEDLLDEVTDLCEWPMAFLGRFETAYLELPEPVLTATMIHHQRFFPVREADGRLAARFAAVRNGGQEDVVRRGNETVLAARLADALFFFKEDRRQTLRARRDQLRGIAYAPKLGTLYDRSVRLAHLAGKLAELAGHPDLKSTLEEAGALALCDRATALVRELPELEGTMAKAYAQLDGEGDAVCRAVGERVRPRGAEDELPETPEGTLLALADRLDHLVGFLASGRAPTGSQDPFGLRRAAIGALRLWERLPGLSLPDALDAALAGYSGLLGDAAAGAREQLPVFLAGRLASRAEEQGHDARLMQAVLAAGIEHPGNVFARLAALEEVAEADEFTPLVHAARRAKNLAKEGDDFGAVGEEAALLSAVESVEREGDALFAGGDYAGYLRRASTLYAPLDRFFTELMIMSEVPEERSRRQAILHRAHLVLSRVAEIAALSAE